MTQASKFKKRVHAVAKEKGIPYSAARRLLKAQDECDAFNAKHEVGTVVQYWRGVRGEPEGEGMGVTRSAAQVLGGHTPVVWIEGCSGCIALTHVQPIPVGKPRTDPRFGAN